MTLNQHQTKWRKTSRNLVLVFSGLISLAVLACQSTPPATQPPVRAATPKPPAKVQTRFTKAEFGERWPFTVDEGEIDCIPLTNEASQGAVVLRTKKGTYSINGQIRRKNLAGSWASSIPPAIVESGSRICKQKVNH